MKPFFSIEEKKAVCDYMDEGGFITEYKKTKIFESMICDFTGAKHCIVTNNGTISLTLAAIALGVKSGDEVIVPNYTMIATPNSMLMIGATPVFVDIEPETLCLDPALLANAITKKTKGIVLVSANGRYPKNGFESIKKIALEHNLFILEDAAQSLGSFYPNGRHIGRMGDIGSFSFSSPKIISTGQGGALITDNDTLADALRKLKDFGRSEGGMDIHDSIGFNFKFTELQACIGIEQMKKLSARIKRKKEIWKKYDENLHSLKKLKLFQHNLDTTAPWFIDCIVENRTELVAYLKEYNIGTRLMYPPINKQKAYALGGQFPESNFVGQNGLWLPSFVQIKDNEIDYITEKILNFYS